MKWRHSIFYMYKECVRDYKMFCEYRILHAFNQYVRIIEQYSLPESDQLGNIWLGLSVLGLYSDQSAFDCVKSEVLNRKTGDHFSLQELYALEKEVGLTNRRIEILQMVKEGMLSKEISE